MDRCSEAKGFPARASGRMVGRDGTQGPGGRNRARQQDANHKDGHAVHQAGDPPAPEDDQPLHAPERARSACWRGFRVQIIWHTPEYGGHLGHIHVGVRRL